MSRNFLLATIFLVITFLAGCSGREVKIPLEGVGMVGIMAFDYIDGHTMKLSVAIPQYSPDAKETTQIFTVSTDLVSKGIVDIEALSDKKIVLNQLRVVLINEEFAREGNVEKAIRHLYRNAELGNKVLLAVVKENGEELIRAKYPDKPNINFYLNDLLLPTINTAFNPNTNIHDFMYTMTNPVFDPIMPVIEKKEGHVEIKGVALFKDKHMYETITPGEALIIQALQGKKKLAPLVLELDQGHGKEKLMLDLIKSKVKIKSNKSMKSPKLTISLNIAGTLSEYRGEREKKLNSLKGITNLENAIDEQIEKDIDQFLEKLKELKVDPIGLTE
ncbi:MAG: Ger(x)C family spore germination protein, partial [Lysinibacillus sp.]